MRKYLIFLFIFSLFTNLIFSSTVGIATGKSTIDGRPLLFKNKDQTDDYPSDVNYFNGGDEYYSYVYQQNNGQDHTRARMGINSVGLGIVYSDSENLDGASTGPYASQLTATALKTCASIEEFKNLLDQTNGVRKAHNHFAVIDSMGKGSMFEVDGYSYIEIPIVDSVGVMANTAKFHPSRGAAASGSTSPEREARAMYLLTHAPGDSLDYKYFTDEIIKDFCETQEDEDNMPLGQYLTNPVLSRYKTAAGGVIRGMKNGDNPILTNMMWIALSEPSLTIALPLFSNINFVPSFIRSFSVGYGMAGSSDKVRQIVYDYSNGRYADRYVETFLLLPIREHNFKIQDSLFNSYEHNATIWENMQPDLVKDDVKAWINESHSWAKEKYDSLVIILDVDEMNNNDIYYLSIQNYPNPFNSSTKIKYTVPNILSSNKSFVSIKIFDSLGRKVTRLIDKYQSSGEYEIEFNAKNLSSGNYYCILQVGQNFQTTKLVYLK